MHTFNTMSHPHTRTSDPVSLCRSRGLPWGLWCASWSAASWTPYSSRLAQPTTTDSLCKERLQPLRVRSFPDKLNFDPRKTNLQAPPTDSAVTGPWLWAMAEEKVESEVATQLDLSVIRYSRVVEDHRVLSRALQIEADKDVVMCITRWSWSSIQSSIVFIFLLPLLSYSSGDNVLNLLLDRPKKIRELIASKKLTLILFCLHVCTLSGYWYEPSSECSTGDQASCHPTPRVPRLSLLARWESRKSRFT